MTGCLPLREKLLDLLMRIDDNTNMTWKPVKRKWNWRLYLTAEEKALVAKADKLAAELRALQGQKNMIMNRAIQRAKYEASK